MAIVDNYIKSTVGYHCRMSNLVLGQQLWTLDWNSWLNDHKRDIIQTKVVGHTVQSSNFVVKLGIDTEYTNHSFLFLPSDLLCIEEESWVPVANLEVGDNIEFITKEMETDYCQVSSVEFLNETSSGYNLVCFPENSFLVTPLGMWCKSTKPKKME